jgi:hypothetical protein
MIKEIITPVMPPTPFIVICQSWPCWLSTILALCLPLHRAFFPKQFHDLFKLTGWASSDASWSTLEEINLPSSSSCFILGSGSYTFFQSFLETLHRNPCSFIFSLDVRFPHITQQDVKCQSHTATCSGYLGLFLPPDSSYGLRWHVLSFASNCIFED